MTLGHEHAPGRSALFGFFGLALLGAAPALVSQEQPNPNDLRVYWKDGLRLDSADKRFRFKVGGRIQADWAVMSETSGVRAQAGKFEDATEFRRARLYVSGTLYERVIFKAQYDFAGGDADFKDVYMGLTGLGCLGTLKIGHHKEPFSLEELTSSKYVTFMERGLPNAFSPSRNMGVSLSNTLADERATWAIGVFRDTDGFGNLMEDGGYNASARLTCLPWQRDDAHLVHVGAAYHLQSATNGMLRFRERPEAHLAPRLVDTGTFNAHAAHVLGAELAGVYGPFSAQGEFVAAVLDAPAVGSPTLTGFYVMASWFPTGEHRVYDRKHAAFGRVKPKSPLFGDEGGWGAWELALRFSRIDLSGGSLTGGELWDLTAGVNWHPNNNTRLSWNYVRADLEDVGQANLFEMRFQIDF